MDGLANGGYVDYAGCCDSLYFPYMGTSSYYGKNADKAEFYWLASPSGSGDGYLFGVNPSGSIAGGAHYSRLGSGCARPVISILKSDFQELFPDISITKPTND